MAPYFRYGATTTAITITTTATACLSTTNAFKGIEENFSRKHSRSARGIKGWRAEKREKADGHHRGRVWLPHHVSHSIYNYGSSTTVYYHFYCVSSSIIVSLHPPFPPPSVRPSASMLAGTLFVVVVVYSRIVVIIITVIALLPPNLFLLHMEGEVEGVAALHNVYCIAHIFFQQPTALKCAPSASAPKMMTTCSGSHPHMRGDKWMK